MQIIVILQARILYHQIAETPSAHNCVVTTSKRLLSNFRSIFLKVDAASSVHAMYGRIGPSFHAGTVGIKVLGRVASFVLVRHVGCGVQGLVEAVVASVASESFWLFDGATVVVVILDEVFDVYVFVFAAAALRSSEIGVIYHLSGIIGA